MADKKYKIAIADTGYVGLRIATLLAQHSMDMDHTSLHSNLSYRTNGNDIY